MPRRPPSPPLLPSLTAFLGVSLLLQACGSEDASVTATPAGPAANSTQAAKNPHPAAESTAVRGAKLALLVGIDHYTEGSGPQWPSLDGCVRDVERVRGLLLDRFGFHPDDVLVLTNEQATHRALVEAIEEHLIHRAGPETEVLYWHSGHGSRVPDLSGDAAAEFEDMDSTLVPYDARAGGGDLTDDELQSLLRALCARTPRVTVVTDSCHSGGVTRGPGERVVRSAPDGDHGLSSNTLPTWWPQTIPFLEDGDPRRGRALPYVHIAACAPFELAEEIRVRDSRGRVRHFGALSYFLCQALREAPPGVSYRWLAREAAVRVARHAPTQSVQFEGPLDRQLFAGDFLAPPPGFPAQLDPQQDPPIEVEAGLLQLLREGSLLQVLGEDGSPLGEATLSAVGDGRSSAQWNGPPPAGLKRSAVRVVELSRPSEDPPLRIALDAKLNPAWAAALSAAEECRLEVVAEPEQAEYLLTASANLELRTDSGLVLWRLANPNASATAEAVESLLARLRTEQRHRALLALAEAPAAVSVEMRFLPAEEQDWQQWAPVYGLGPFRPLESPEGGKVRGEEAALRVVDHPGEDAWDLVKLEVEMPTGPRQKAMYLTVLCISQDRSVSVVFPIDTRQDNLLEPGEVLTLPPIDVFVSEQWPDGLPLRDRYLAILTDEYQNFHPLVRGPFLAHGPAATRGSNDLPEGTDGLPKVLQQALLGRTTRGGSMMRADRSAGFGVTSCDLVVSRPPR